MYNMSILDYIVRQKNESIIDRCIYTSLKNQLPLAMCLPTKKGPGAGNLPKVNVLKVQFIDRKCEKKSGNNKEALLTYTTAMLHYKVVNND